jgi:hypothetical protein
MLGSRNAIRNVVNWCHTPREINNGLVLQLCMKCFSRKGKAGQDTLDQERECDMKSTN